MTLKNDAKIMTTCALRHAGVAVTLAWMAFGGSGVVGGQPSDIDLEGVWRLNYELSDDPSPSVSSEVGQERDDRGYRGGGGGFGAGEASGPGPASVVWPVEAGDRIGLVASARGATPLRYIARWSTS